MERYPRAKINMRYASPDAIRPNEQLKKRTIDQFGFRPKKEHLQKIKKDFDKDFNKKFNIISEPTRVIPHSSLSVKSPSPILPPSPSQLPMPSNRLTRKNHRMDHYNRSDRSESPKSKIIQGKNRKWTIKNKNRGKKGGNKYKKYKNIQK